MPSCHWKLFIETTQRITQQFGSEHWCHFTVSLVTENDYYSCLLILTSSVIKNLLTGVNFTLHFFKVRKNKRGMT